MDRARARLTQLKLLASDVAVCALGFLLAFWIRSDVLAGALGEIYPFSWYVWMLVASMASVPLVLALLKMYELDGVSDEKVAFYRNAGRLFQASLLVYVLLSAIIFSLRLHYVSRLLTFLVVAIDFLLLLTTRALLWPVLLRRAQKEPLRVVIAGAGPSAVELASILSGRQRLGTSVLGFLVEEGSTATRIEGFPVLGSLRDAETVFSTHVVDEVLIAVPEKSLAELEPFLMLCEQQGITARLACDFLPRGSARLYLEPIGGVPLLTFATTPNNPNLLVLKRVVDVALSCVLLVLTSPLFVIVPILIKLTSRGPVFYRQERCGLNGRRFEFLKFRSMVEGADERKREIEHLNEAKGPVFKLSDDPRVTAIGKFLRRTSIDELPQLINVLRGEMSLVGPRPPLPEEVARYEPWQRRRMSMKPGLTCLWQVNGRSELAFDEWVELDLYYIDHWTPWLDLKLLLKTVPAVVTGRGAK